MHEPLREETLQQPLNHRVLEMQLHHFIRHLIRVAKDNKDKAEAQLLAERADVYGITGNRPDAFYVAAKLLWLKTHEPELHARARHFVQINGYFGTQHPPRGRVAVLQRELDSLVIASGPTGQPRTVGES